MERIKAHYYTALIKYEKELDILKDKLLETAIKLPLWGIIQSLFWRVGGIFLSNVHFLTAVYDVLIKFFPEYAAAAGQLLVYYIALNPLLEFVITILEESLQGKREK